MGNLVADAMLARVADQGTAVAIVNGGGLRASIDEGEVTMRVRISALPWVKAIEVRTPRQRSAMSDWGKRWA